MAGLWTRARHPETGGEAIIPVESIPTQAARGWEAYGEPSGDRMTLVVQRDTEAAEAAKAAEVRVVEAATVTEEGAKVAEVLTAVGDDPAAAQAALDAEMAKPKAEQRKTLLPKLQEIINRPDTATTEGN